MAECRLGAGMVVHLLVERLGNYGWDWQMWDPAQHLRMECGVTETLETAKVRAEPAVTGVVACTEAVMAEVFKRLRRAV